MLADKIQKKFLRRTSNGFYDTINNTIYSHTGIGAEDQA